MNEPLPGGPAVGASSHLISSHLISSHLISSQSIAHVSGCGVGRDAQSLQFLHPIPTPCSCSSTLNQVRGAAKSNAKLRLVNEGRDGPFRSSMLRPRRERSKLGNTGQMLAGTRTYTRAGGNGFQHSQVQFQHGNATVLYHALTPQSGKLMYVINDAHAATRQKLLRLRCPDNYQAGSRLGYLLQDLCALSFHSKSTTRGLVGWNEK